jgi:D-ribulokinase
VATKEAMESAKIDPKDVVGLGFDATCSLVCLDSSGNPVTVDPTAPDGDNERNIIVWLDHRAKKQV